mmetsp:Transcript_105567/g.283836  ORF Transcript_105567/g.283836 Transcript_105567/m.283836 type:complete len:88 (-) Transcript_105567:6-269(-)
MQAGARIVTFWMFWGKMQAASDQLQAVKGRPAHSMLFDLEQPCRLLHRHANTSLASSVFSMRSHWFRPSQCYAQSFTIVGFMPPFQG